jgi:hypothetical protein
LSICTALFLWITCHRAESADSAASSPAIFSATSATTPSPDFESFPIEGLNLPLPGPQDTIDPDFAGIRSSLASLVSVDLDAVLTVLEQKVPAERGNLLGPSGKPDRIGLGYTDHPTPVIYTPQTGMHRRGFSESGLPVLRDNLDENGGANQSFKRRPAAKV